MQFSDNVVSEIVIPSNVPFAPGNDVIGIGFTVPAELQAIGFIAAIIFYNSQYSATDTLPRVVYQFIAAGSSPDPAYQTAVAIGYTWQANPSINSPMLVAQSATAGALAPAASGYTTLSSTFSVENHIGQTIAEITEITATASGIFGLFNAANTAGFTKNADDPTTNKSWDLFT